MKDDTKLRNFYSGRRILITGHTGFKGTWMCAVLLELGADVVGYSLEPPTIPSLFDLTEMKDRMRSFRGDVRDLLVLRRVFDEVQPEIVIHMAAQPLVRESYRNPVETYETNVMGTVNLLECVRQCSSVKSVINVTTDKVYRNNEWNRGYVETDYLDGYDPYSNSKSCSELVTHCYVQSFLEHQETAISTCRAGNVIGGGDFATDRIIPDCVKAALSGENIIVRNPYSTRPYQHVLEPLAVYLMIAMEQYQNREISGSYNVGPEGTGCVTTGELTELFCKTWRKQMPESDLNWSNQSDGGPHEAAYLKLDCSKLKSTFGWKPRWSIEQAVESVIELEQLRKRFSDERHGLLPEALYSCMQRQIEVYLYQ